MEDESLKKFTSKMIADKVFSCDSCGNFLQPPTRILGGLTVCSCCSENENGVPNRKLDSVLYELKFPCRNANGGCTQEHYFKDFEEHERNCEFLVRKCLLHDTEIACKWEGILSDFEIHIIGTHTDQVLNVPSQIFVVNFDFGQVNRTVKFLKGKSEIIVLKIDQIDSGATLLHTLSGFEESVRPKSDCVLKHVGKNGTLVKTACQKLESGLYGAKIDSESLKRITDCSDSITIAIATGNRPGNDGNVDEKFLQLFECPVCKNLMRPPIYQCKLGHDICNSCKARVDTCPKCRASFGQARNYTLEEMTAGITYSCAYANMGCDFTHFGDTTNHESFCAYKPFNCPINCNFTGNFSTVLAHVNDQHSAQIIQGNVYKTTMDFRMEHLFEYNDPVQKFYLVFDDNIFRLRYKRNSDYSCWAVENLKRVNSGSVYSYEIGIIDIRKPDRKLMRTDLCFTEALGDEEIFKKCILFPNNILSSYANNGLFTYYCHVNKK